MSQGTTVVESSVPTSAASAGDDAAVRLRATVSVFGIAAFWPAIYLSWSLHFGYPAYAAFVGAALPGAISLAALLLWRVVRGASVRAA